MSIILYGESIISNIHQPVILLLFSHLVMSNSLWLHGLKHSRFPCPSQSPRACSNSCPLSRWCIPTSSSSVIPFSFCLNLSQHQCLFQWVSSLYQVVKVLGLQLQSFQWIFRIDFLEDWLVWSPYSPRDSQESSPTPVWKYQFFSAQLSLWSSSHIRTWLLEKPYRPMLAK